MRLGILSGFSKAGHTVGCFPHHNWLAQNKDKGRKLLTKYIKELRPDCLIFGGYAPSYFNCLPELCKKHGAAFIYWAIEDPVGFDRTLFIAQLADYVFTTTEECIRMYKENGVNARLLLFASNPDFHKSGLYNPDYDIDLAMAASCYNWETRKRGYKIILDAAKESGQSLKVWGAGWQKENCRKILGNPDYFCGYLPNGQLPDLCASAKIILGIQCDDSSLTQTSMRPYEVLGCGGFHLTQWTKATVNIFQDDRHLTTARTKGEAAEKIEYYVNHPSERLKIAKQGREFVYKHHTYERRVRDIVFPWLGIKAD